MTSSDGVWLPPWWTTPQLARRRENPATRTGSRPTILGFLKRRGGDSNPRYRLRGTKGFRALHRRSRALRAVMRVAAYAHFLVSASSYTGKRRPTARLGPRAGYGNRAATRVALRLVNAESDRSVHKGLVSRGETGLPGDVHSKNRRAAICPRYTIA